MVMLARSVLLKFLLRIISKPLNLEQDGRTALALLFRSRVKQGMAMAQRVGPSFGRFAYVPLICLFDLIGPNDSPGRRNINPMQH